MATITLKSDLYKNESISNFTFTPERRGASSSTITFTDVDTLTAAGFTFDPTDSKYGLEEGDIFGTYTIVYDNGCSHQEVVTGDTANCSDFTVSMVEGTENGVYLEGQSSMSLFSNPTNGFTLHSVSPAVISGAANTSYAATFTIPEYNPQGTLYEDWNDTIECDSVIIKNPVTLEDCDYFNGVTVADTTPNFGQAIELNGVPAGIEYEVTPNVFTEGTTSYSVEYTSTPAVSNVYFGSANNPAYVLSTCPDFTFTQNIYTCEFALASIDQDTDGFADIFTAAVSNYIDEGTLPAGATYTVANPSGQDAWVLSASDVAYTVTVNLSGTGYYNSDGEYEGDEVCTVYASACYDDLTPTYNPQAGV